MAQRSRCGLSCLALVASLGGIGGCADVADDARDVGDAEEDLAAQAASITMSQDARVLLADGTEGGFGSGLAVSGDTAVIGSVGQPYESVHVFQKTDEQWVERALLSPGDGEDGDLFGRSIAIEGDTVVVGSFLHGKTKKNGAAYVFVRDAHGDWSQQAKLVASDGRPFDLFGHSVALSGDTILVGAFQAEQKKGAAYVFVREGGVWIEQAKLMASDAEPGDELGVTAALSGDTAVLSAEADDDNGDASGSVYVFARERGGWAEEAKLLASDGEVYDFLGYPVAIYGDTIMAGTYLKSTAGPNEGGGAVYVYERGGPARGQRWREEAKLVPKDIKGSDWFGISIALSEAGAIIGSSHADAAGIDSGSAYLFSKCGGAWREQHHLLGRQVVGGSEFGYKAALSSDGSVAAIGAPMDNDGAGSVYMFDLDSRAFCESAPPCAGSHADARDSADCTEGAAGPNAPVNLWLSERPTASPVGFDAACDASGVGARETGAPRYIAALLLAAGCLLVRRRAGAERLR